MHSAGSEAEESREEKEIWMWMIDKFSAGLIYATN